MKIAFPKQRSRGAPSSTEGNYSREHVVRVIGRIFNRCRELIFSVAQSITCPWRNAHARCGGGNGRGDGWPGRGGGWSQQRGRQGAVNKTRSLELHSHYAAIHEICQPFGFHALHAFLRLFRKPFFFSLPCSNLEETVSPTRARLPRQPPARFPSYLPLRLKRNRDESGDEDSFLHSSIRYRLSKSTPLKFHCEIEMSILFWKIVSLIIRNNYVG